MNSICNIQEEQQKFINELGLENSDFRFNKKPSYIRGTLRLIEYNKWCQLQVHGKGVILFQQSQPANSLMESRMELSRMELSSMEWRDAVKLQGNLSPIRALHGRCQYNSGCGHCNERETLPHVLCFCHYGELLRNNRHHLMNKIAAGVKLNSNHLEVYKEVHCVPSNGSNRRVDIFAVDPSKKLGYISDPTV